MNIIYTVEPTSQADQSLLQSTAKRGNTNLPALSLLMPTENAQEISHAFLIVTRLLALNDDDILFRMSEQDARKILYHLKADAKSIVQKSYC